MNRLQLNNIVKYIKNIFLGFLLCYAALSPTDGHAVPVTVEFAGSVTSANDINIIGELFDVRVRLDTDAVLLGIDSGGSFDPGQRYRYDPSSISMIVNGPGLTDVAIAASPIPDFVYNLFYVRDNSSDVNAVLGGPPVTTDGISLSVQDASWRSRILIRGTILDMFDGGAITPGLFDPRLLDQELSVFSFSRSDGMNSFLGTIESFSVIPAPGTLALVVTGLAVIGFARQNKNRTHG